MPPTGSHTPQTRPESCLRIFQTGAMFGTGRGKKCGIRKNPLSNRKLCKWKPGHSLWWKRMKQQRLRPCGPQDCRYLPEYWWFNFFFDSVSYPRNPSVNLIFSRCCIKMGFCHWHS